VRYLLLRTSIATYAPQDEAKGALPVSHGREEPSPGDRLVNEAMLAGSALRRQIAVGCLHEPVAVRGLVSARANSIDGRTQTHLRCSMTSFFMRDSNVLE